MAANVVVLGMHRSGTSAITNALRLLGFSLGRTGDLTAPRPANPEGNWEHLRLTRCNERILEAHGGTWDEPPELPDGWAQGPKATSMIARLRAEFDEIYPAEGWLWKDPRACLTLPLWLRVWDSTPVVVMVFRHPIAVARSLEARNGFPQDHALSLWERYNRRALADIRNLPAVVRNYDGAFADPRGFARGLRDDLASLGATGDGSVVEAATAFKVSLRRNLAGERDLAVLTVEQRQLWKQLTR